jgi:hypothetical protein
MPGTTTETVPEVVNKTISEQEAEIHGAQTRDGAEPVTTTTENETVTVTTEADEEVTVDIDDITLEDGQFRFVIDPTDPNSTVYVGKDMKELLSNIRTGTKVKDDIIRKARSTERVSATNEETVRKILSPQKDDVNTVNPLPEPDLAAITQKHCAAAKIPPSALTWTDANWIESQEKNQLKDWQLIRHQNMVENIRTAIDNEYQTRNVEFINSNSFLSETEEVQALLDASGIDAGKFDYENVLSAVASDEKNYMKNGILKPGVLVKAAGVELLRLAKASDKSKLKADLERAIAEGNEAKERISASGGGTRSQIKPVKGNKPIPKNSEDAARQALDEWNKSQKVKSGRL